VTDTHDTLLFFTDKGRVFSLRVFELSADQSRNSRGTPIANVLNLSANEKVTAMLTVSSLLENIYLVMVTKQGKIKRMHLPLLRNMNRAGLNTFKLAKDDQLVSVSLADADEDIAIITRDGLSIRFPSSQVRSTQRGAGGIRGIRMNPKDIVVFSDVVNPDGYLLIIGRRGKGKLSDFRHYKSQNRGGKGLLTLKVTSNTGKVAAAAIVSPEIYDNEKDNISETNGTKKADGNLFVLTDKAQVIRTRLSEIKTTGRVTQGVNVLTPAPGDAISGARVLESRRKTREEIDPKDLEIKDSSEEIEISSEEIKDSEEESKKDEE